MAERRLLQACANPEGLKVSVKIFDLKYIENGDRYEVGPREHLYIVPMGFRLAPSGLTADDLEGSKSRSYILTRNVKNGTNYDV